LDVSSINKTIRALNGVHPESQVALGVRTLAIGNTGQTDGGGAFAGKFTGTGNVIKTGTAVFEMSGENTATGSLTVLEGKLRLANSWGGNLSQMPGTTLDVIGNVNIGGGLTLAGGTIGMDLTQTSPSKMDVANALSTTGTTTLSIATGEISNYMLLQAASGVNNTFFTLNLTGATGMLSTMGVQILTFSTTSVTDVTPPAPGSGVDGAVSGTTASLSWDLATDNLTPQSNLRYFVYQSLSNNIQTVANCEDNGILANLGGTNNISAYDVSGLIPSTDYWFNVVVADLSGNKAAYTPQALTTQKATLSGQVAIIGNPVFGETLTADISQLTSVPVIADLGTLTYLWKSGATSIGGNSATYELVEGDVARTITVTVTSSVCDGSIDSPPTTAVQKAAQTAPSSPALSSATATEVTLTATTGCEYRINEGEWQTSNIFSGLQPNTGYEFDARKAETATHDASLPSEPVTYATDVEIIAYAPFITTENMPRGEKGKAYSQTLAAEGDTPIAWTVSSGSLPDGLSLSGSGDISGTPAVVGTFSFTVKATNNVGEGTRELTVAIDETRVPPAIITENLSDVTVGDAFFQMLEAEGDIPIEWTVSSGDLPDGLTLAENGSISGTPTVAGTFEITVKAENSTGVDTKEMTITVVPKNTIPAIATADLPDGIYYEIYNQTLDATGSSPISWSLESGVLPTGLALYSHGLILGIPSEEGVFNFTVKASNIVGDVTKALTITINDNLTPPEILIEELPEGILEEEYDEMLYASGSDPITWTLVLGALPDGLDLTDEGFISGTPTVVGTFNFTVTATNAKGDDTKALTITIAAERTYTISASPESLPFGSLQTPYEQPAPQTVTITSTGTGAVTLTQPAATNYDVDAL